jgi:hypothetical protein
MLLKFIPHTWILHLLLAFQALSFLPSFINKNGIYIYIYMYICIYHSDFTVNWYWWKCINNNKKTSTTTTPTTTTTTTTTTSPQTTTTDKQGSNNIGSVDQSDKSSTPQTFCLNKTCTYAHHFKRSKHFYLPTHNIQDKSLSHYTGSLLWPILSLLSNAIPIFCKEGSTHFSWIYCTPCMVLFTTFEEGVRNGFLWLVHTSHLQNMLFIVNWSSGETSDRNYHLSSA